MTFLGIEPFSEVKNKWLSGLRCEMGWFYCAVDDRAVASNSCNSRGYGKTRMAPTRYDHLRHGHACGRGPPELRQSWVSVHRRAIPVTGHRG